MQGIQVNLQGLAEEQGDVKGKVDKAKQEAQAIKKDRDKAKAESDQLDGDIKELNKQKEHHKGRIDAEKSMMGSTQRYLDDQKGDVG